MKCFGNSDIYLIFFTKVDYTSKKKERKKKKKKAKEE